MSRKSRPALLLLVIAMFVMQGETSSAAAAPLGLDPCAVPGPQKVACEAVDQVAQGGKDAIEKGPGGVAKDVVQDAAGAVTEPVFEQLTSWVGDGAAWLIGGIGKAIDETTTPHLEARWFQREYDKMALLAVVFALPLFFLGLGQAALRRDWGVLGRTVRAVPWAFVLTGVAVSITGLLLQATDWASSVVASSAGDSSREFFADVRKAFTTMTAAGAATGTGAAGVPLFVAFLAAVFAALAAFAVWLELLIRSAGIYVCVLFFPFVLAARIWPPLEKWAKRLAEGLAAIILSKFVIVAVLSLAAAGLANSRAAEGFNGALAGAALLLLAAFAPLVLFRLVSFAESSWDGRAGTAGSAARGVSTTSSAAYGMQMLMARNNPGGGLTAVGAGAAGGHGLGGRGGLGGGRDGGGAAGAAAGTARAGGGGGAGAGGAAAGSAAGPAGAAAAAGAGIVRGVGQAGRRAGQQAASSAGGPSTGRDGGGSAAGPTEPPRQGEAGAGEPRRSGGARPHAPGSRPGDGQGGGLRGGS